MRVGMSALRNRTLVRGEVKCGRIQILHRYLLNWAFFFKYKIYIYNKIYHLNHF